MIDAADETVVAGEAKSYPFEFKGETGEYFGIWIVNLILSILTLGVYSAWAKVRSNRYFYGNTSVAGSSFDYTAEPQKILVGRVIAVSMLIGYQVSLYFFPTVSLYFLVILLLFLPLIYLSSLAFKMRYSQWRNIKFEFERDVVKVYLLFAPMLIYLLVVIGGPMLFGVSPEELAASEESEEVSAEMANYLLYSGIAVSVAALLFPLWQRYYYQFVGNRVRLGKSEFQLHLKTSSFYAMYLAAAGMAMIAFFIIVLFIVVDLFGFFESEEISLTQLLILYLVLIIPYVFVFALIKTQLTNLVYNNLKFPKVRFKCSLKLSKMCWLYFTNTLAIIATLSLAIPWAKIRLARYRAENMFLISESGEIEVKGADQQDVSAGKLYDGQSSRSHDVDIEFGENGRLKIFGYGIAPVHPDDVSVSERIGDSARYLTLSGGIIVESNANEEIDQWLECWQPQKSTAVFKLESNKKAIVVALLAFVMFIYVTVTEGIPAASSLITRNLPTAVDNQLGEEVLDQLDGLVFSPTRIDSARQQELRALFATLLPDASRNYQLEFRASELLGANAIALPNAQIILTDDLVALAQNTDMIAAILLHEIGHVVERHAMRGVISQAGLTMLLFGLTGDVASSAGVLIVLLPEFLLQSGYSRELEWEADTYALEEMLARGMDTNAFADMMARLVTDGLEEEAVAQDGEVEAESFLDYFSSHPPSIERINRFRDAANDTAR
ncbi:yjgN [Symbiodinium microadriaticum]|nr:yjgN [Symbiodinium microadriaticum]